ncbi:MAG: NAD-dependent epimerase/dehydratase family protein [Candidatus Coprenecus sp.]|nr:NAD-dependent epimerase/dehydratase family protein [Candidatus Coprenecus sp.]
MKILVTGAKGFVGKNLCATLNNIRDGKMKVPTSEGNLLKISEIFEYDIDSSDQQLEKWCSECDFVFNLAGVNRPVDPADFMKGNHDFSSRLLDTLKRYGNLSPVMVSSSIQASLTGRFSGSQYGRSKRAAEDLFLDYSAHSGTKVLIYRFPNIFGKWCRPGYNSAIATFCHNIANNLPITVNDPSVELELLYIDDLIDEMLLALQSKEHRCESDPRYCFVPITHKEALGEIAQTITSFGRIGVDIEIPTIAPGTLTKKLLSTYLSYLPAEKTIFSLKMNCDHRGSFTELLHTQGCGQISINISKPGITKGEHWHHSKWEIFTVVKGEALIRMRKEGTDQITEFRVSGEKIESVIMLPGYTHNIINLSPTQDLVTVMYCNETFNPEHPDTWYDPVETTQKQIQQ